jgi:hypothetical protein
MFGGRKAATGGHDEGRRSMQGTRTLRAVGGHFCRQSTEIAFGRAQSPGTKPEGRGTARAHESSRPRPEVNALTRKAFSALSLCCCAGYLHFAESK